MTLETMSFEQAIMRLEEVVRDMESGQLPLDQALELFAEGINLSKYCNQCLEKAEHKISLLMADGELTEAPPTLSGGER
ncbi:exodeoxyribonuclease VII small subunit [Desulforamulus aquiferis]|uniref:Exodeoxyribonuclease 7 small subunit n=1 Tax=Desulforamulus aquiferis TaxID=1397668 RepID=A0AAW7Z9I8_9FIRM|nr:exodeoxyribonuclease VII small subunit [Desulforamulus aquiferis]MDO7786398.1 exodeoxyribonuclease VII small subunit [Desulforamulus aquiferis]